VSRLILITTNTNSSESNFSTKMFMHVDCCILFDLRVYGICGLDDTQ